MFNNINIREAERTRGQAGRVFLLQYNGMLMKEVGVVQVIGIFVVADLLVPLKQVWVLDIFDHNLLPTFLLVS